MFPQEGFRFSPPKLETFFKDDENHDPQWSREQLLEAALVVGGVKVTPVSHIGQIIQ